MPIVRGCVDAPVIFVTQGRNALDVGECHMSCRLSCKLSELQVVWHHHRNSLWSRQMLCQNVPGCSIIQSSLPQYVTVCVPVVYCM